MNKNTQKSDNRCREWQDKLEILYELPDDDPTLQIWKEHCKECAECQAFLLESEQLTEVLSSLPSLGEVDLFQGLLQRIREKEATDLSLKRNLLFGGIATSVVGIIAGIIIGKTDIEQILSQQRIEIQEGAIYANVLSEVGDIWLTVPDLFVEVLEDEE